MKTSRLLKPCEQKNLVKTAKRAGFTEEGLRYMFTILGLEPRTMDYDTYKEVLPYVNQVNAKRFNPIVKEG